MGFMHNIMYIRILIIRQKINTNKMEQSDATHKVYLNIIVNCGGQNKHLIS